MSSARNWRRYSIVFVSAFLVANPVDGADPPHVLEAALLGDADAITIDGRLDEPAWARAVPAGDFRQMEPDNGAPATERTEVRILYDRHRLIVGVSCFDTEAGRILGNQLQRDQTFAGDDRFMVSLDTFADGRSGYYFEINPAGAMGDGLIVPGGIASTNGSVNRSWDGIWLARVTRTEIGWTAEIELPFRTLNFDRSATAWGVNFQRSVRRKNEETLWTGYARNEGITYMAAAGHLEGLRDLTQGIGLDLRPYITGTSEAAPARQIGPAEKGAIGGDLFYNLTPSLRANFSVNTDFAETEVDQRRINLTRFPLFFPEKRAFFLEGSSFFDFAREPGNAIVPFFSRRIGLDDSGLPQPIAYGLKLTGQAQSFDLGILQMQTRQAGRVAADNFDVIRVRRRFLRQSYIGALYTRRDQRDGRAQQTAGADVVVATSRFLGAQVLEFSSFLLNTTKLPGSRGGLAYGARLSLPNDPWYARLGIRNVENGYDPAVGFVDRRGYRLGSWDVRYSARNWQNRVVRRVSWESIGDFFFDPEGNLETRRLDIQLARVELQPGDLIEFHLLPNYEHLPRDFAIHSGVVLPAGSSYDFLRRHFQVQSASQRTIAVSGFYESGSFYSGGRDQLNATISIRPHAGWLIGIGGEHNDVRLKEGQFSTDVWRADLNTQFTPWISLVNTTQYDTLTRGLGWQVRFRWITSPGNDIFFTYNHNWVETSRLTTQDRRAAIKLVRTLRF